MQQSNAAAQGRDAPPKRVAQALEQLGLAGKLMGDVRLGTDRLLEAFLNLAEDTNESLNLMVKQDALMMQHFRDLRAIGKQLEESGVLTESLRSQADSQALNMKLGCPNGAAVNYAWKRQVTVQTVASAVDKSRLALQTFKDQKRKFFPHLADDDDSGVFPASEKQCNEEKSLSDILSLLEKEVPGLQTFTYKRFDWFKRVSSVASTTHQKPSESPDSTSMNATDEATVIVLVLPDLFRAIVSLSTAGSMDPDAVAFFSPYERGSHIHAGGFSLHHVYRHVSEHASTALQHFVCAHPGSSLHYLLHWICSYETLFSRACSKCNNRLAMDKRSGVLLPPVKRPYHKFAMGGKSSGSESRNVNNPTKAFHIGCIE